MLQHSLNTFMTRLSSVMRNERNKIRKTILDVPVSSVRSNLIFLCILEHSPKNDKRLIKKFKVNKNTDADNLTLRSITYTVCRRERKCQQPTFDKSERAQKNWVLSKGSELSGMDYGINDQFPCEIVDKRKRLLTVGKLSLKEGCINDIKPGEKDVISVDKLYSGQLYCDKNVIPLGIFLSLSLSYKSIYQSKSCSYPVHSRRYCIRLLCIYNSNHCQHQRKHPHLLTTHAHSHTHISFIQLF